MALLTVALDESDPGALARHRWALASLPRTFRAVSEPDPDAVVVAGSRPDWVTAVAAAIQTGVRGVLISPSASGTPDEVRQLHQLALEHHTGIVIENAVLDPTWQQTAPTLREFLPHALLLHTVAVGAHDRQLSVAAMQQLSLVHSLTPDLTDACASRSETDAYAVSATGPGGAPIAIAGVVDVAGSGAIELDLVGSHEQWQVRFDASTLAAPTRVTRFAADGAHAWPEIYETADRIAWRHLAAQIDDNNPAAFTLEDLANVLASLAKLGLADEQENAAQAGSTQQ